MTEPTVGQMRDFDRDTYMAHLDAGTVYQMSTPRNYLEEASAILESRTMMLPLREHLQALSDRLKETLEDLKGT